jgi:ATP-binding cassette, subfamily B, bacterial PglK
VNPVKKLWYILTPGERIEGASLLIAMVLGAVFETVSIGFVFPFIAILKQPELIAKSERLKPLVSHLNLNEPRQLFFVFGLTLIALFAFKTGYMILLYSWLFRYAVKKHVNLARQLLAGYLSAPYVFHLQRNSADLIRTTTRSVEDFATIFLVNLLIAMGELLVLVALTGLLMFIEPVGTLGALAVLGIPTALVYRLTHRRLGRSGRVAEASFASLIQWSEQAISSVKEITITGRRSFFINQHSQHVQGFANSLRSLTLLTTIPRFVLDTLAVAAMLAIAAILLGRGQDLQSSLLLMGMFALAAVRLIPSLSRLSSALSQLRYRYASTDIIYRELLALRQRPTDPLPGSAEERVRPIPFLGGLVVDHVSYSYPETNKRVIEDVSLKIPKGHWVTFIGPTGAGKTTLADLLLGLLTPTSGRILIDGRDLQENCAGWQRNIGYVPQSVYLIDDSIRRNIAFGVPENEIDDEQVWRALRAAQIDFLVRSLPGELNAIVGERGGRLSGGERQRLGIARALYRDPEILVIDEGTANLDPETEAAVVKVVGGLRGRRTIIVIAHRLAFAKNCDCIYMMAQGRVRNWGGYSDLLLKELAFLESYGDPTEAIAADGASSL